MSTSSLLLLFGIAAIFGWGIIFDGNLPKVYYARQCQGRDWRRTFPSSTKKEILEFLSLFASAFALDEHKKLEFSPEDKITEIYRAQYPGRFQPEAMEFETLARDLELHYNLKLAAVWKEGLRACPSITYSSFIGV
jgi:hypothetical protein